MPTKRIGRNMTKKQEKLLDDLLVSLKLERIKEKLYEARIDEGKERGLLHGENPNDNKPLAAKGLTSYRSKSPLGYIMIGAKDHDDAHREAKRSYDGAKREDLEIWNGKKYVKAHESTNEAVPDHPEWKHEVHFHNGETGEKISTRHVSATTPERALHKAMKGVVSNAPLHVKVYQGGKLKHEKKFGMNEADIEECAA